MDRFLETAMKGLLIVIFAPFLICVAFQAIVAVIAIVLPWLIFLSVITGVAAGLTAGLILRRRLPPRRGGGALTDGGQVPPGEPIRRPRSRGRQEG